MKLSVLIKELQEIYEQEGDLPVFTLNSEFGTLDESCGAYADEFRLTQNEIDFGGAEDILSEGQLHVVLR